MRKRDNPIKQENFKRIFKLRYDDKMHSPYFVDKTALWDVKISLEATGLLAVLMFTYASLKFHVGHLQHFRPEKERKLILIIQELILAGYVEEIHE